MGYVELLRKSSSKPKKKMEYIPPQKDHGYQTIQRMLIKDC